MALSGFGFPELRNMKATSLGMIFVEKSSSAVLYMQI